MSKTLTFAAILAGRPFSATLLHMVGTALRPIEGGARIAQYMVAVAGTAPGLHLLERSVNGVPGLVAERAGTVVTVASFDITGGRVSRIWVVRNPEKLRPWRRASRPAPGTGTP